MQNLEEAYKKSIQEEAPDLWARIEEKLPEKKKKNKIISITRALGVAAAALFLCILIPSVLRIGGSKDASTEAAFDTAANFNSADAMAQVTGEVEDAGMESATSKDTAPEDASLEEFMAMDSAEGGMEESNNSINDSLSTEDEKVFNSEVAENTQMADRETMATGSSKPETVQQNLTVQEIVQCDEYKILVLSAVDGNEWRAYASNDLDISLKIGENYDFTLQKQEGEEWEYVLISAE